MARAVLFDLFETLITESGTQPAGVSAVGPKVGCEPQAFRKEWKAIRPAVTIGALSFREAIREIACRLGGQADETTVQRLSDERTAVKAAPFARIEPQVLTMIDSLRNRGLRLGVVSNCFAEDVAAWSHCALAPRFECAVFSFEVGLAKPDPRIFLEATRRLTVAPCDTYYICDAADDELSGAERAGLRAFKALWFLRRWPHYRDVTCSVECIDTVQDVLQLVDE